MTTHQATNNKATTQITQGGGGKQVTPLNQRWGTDDQPGLNKAMRQRNTNGPH